MDQQHQNNYESFNDFSFVNAFAAGSENSYLNQQVGSSDINSKSMSELGLPTLMNQEFDQRTIGNSSLYDLSNPQYSQIPYHQMPSSRVVSATVLHQKEKSMVENSLSTLDENVEKKMVNDQFPNQPCSSKSSDTVSFDPSQNSMMKALGVVRKDVLASSTNNKKRKRIVVLNDDSDDDTSKLKNEVFNKSNDNLNETTLVSEEKGDASESDLDDTDNDEGENLTDIGALKAKFLLKNAVIIQGPDKKKKKSRLLDSDDESQMQATSVDDIGLMNEDDNEDESFENDILINDPIVPIEDPVTSTEYRDEETKLEKQSTPSEAETLDKTSLDKENLTKSSSTVAEDVNEGKLNEKLKLSESEKNDVEIKTTEASLKTQNEDENEIDPSMSVEAILENIKPMADDDEFFKFDKSSDDNGNSEVPNDEYFGTPDKQQQQQG